MLKRILLLLLLATLPSWAALPFDAAWELRTTGDDDNGGCYDTGGSGTDFSQQDAAQLSLTDLATSGIGVTTLTSVTGGFTAAMVDNCIQIRSGTNVTACATGGACFYEITVRTDTNTVTLDRAPDDGVGGISGGSGDVGGALASPGKAAQAMVGGNTVHHKSGTYTITSTSSNISGGVVIPPAGASDTAITRWIGYETTREDDGVKPKIIADGVITNAVLFDVAASRVFVRNMHWDGNGQSGIEGAHLDNAENQALRLRFSNFVDFAFKGANTRMFDVEMTACTASPSAHIDSGQLFGLYADGSGPIRIIHEGLLSNFILDNSTGDGLSITQSAMISNGSIYSPVDDGVEFTGTAVRASLVINVLVEDAGGYSFRAGTLSSVILRNSGSRNPTSGHTQNIYDDGGLLEATADFFTDPDNDDFSLNNTAGGGASARAAGFPGVYSGAATTGFLDMGAAQHEDPAGGGGNTIITQGVSF